MHWIDTTVDGIALNVSVTKMTDQIWNLRSSLNFSLLISWYSATVVSTLLNGEKDVATNE